VTTTQDQQFAEEILRTETGDARTLRLHENILVGTVAICWALFQLALAGFLVLDSTKVRAIHLAFAITLLFLLAPCLKKPRRYLGFLSFHDRIPVIDYILALLGCLAALRQFPATW
jgi:TRAP-type uncharacterized transport system fused permease subunit